MRRLSNTLLYAGLVVCALGAVGIAGGMWVNLPPATVRLIAMALPFEIGGILLIVGAAVGRAARRAEHALPAAPGHAPLGTGDTPPSAARAGSTTPVRSRES